MSDHRKHTVCVFDFGLFTELAVTLSKSFGRTLFYCPWQDGYPKSNALLIGSGIPGVERIKSIWPYLDEIDLFVFPDVYEGPLQEHLVSLGKRVWGSRLGEELELDRIASKEMCAAAGIDIGPYEVVTGLANLRKFLKYNDDQWVKISATRGDMETFHSKTYALSEPRLDELEHNLGAKKHIMEFIVEEGISPAVEAGYDGYTIDGKYAKGAFVGIEVKDKGLVGKAMRYRDMPESAKSVNAKLAPMFKKYGYRGFFSSEIRCTPDGKAYLIDPCCRSGSPCNELYQLMVSNLADIIWEGSEGTLVEPEYLGKYGAELLLTSEWAMTNWQAVEFPKELRDHVKLRNLTIIDGKYYYVPDKSNCSAIGAVVAMGDTADAAIEECKEIAEQVSGHHVEVATASLDEAHEDLKKYLGAKVIDKEPTAAERKAEALYRKGAISDKAYDKMRAGAEQ